MPNRTVSREIMCPRTGIECTISVEDALVDYSVATFTDLNARSLKDNRPDMCTANSTEEEKCGFIGWMKCLERMGDTYQNNEGDE